MACSLHPGYYKLGHVRPTARHAQVVGQKIKFRTLQDTPGQLTQIPQTGGLIGSTRLGAGELFSAAGIQAYNPS